MAIATFRQFEKYLKSRIPKKQEVFENEIGLNRAKYFLRLLGNPQNKIKVIHIAGTSGKGSTAHLISHILKSQGFRVGLSISPHMFDIRERMQIDNSLPDKKLILKYFNQILPSIKKMESCKFGAPTFFEINVGLAYLMFAKEKLDYAIMETGLGGRLDATNCVASKNKISIITKIGRDHMEILGNTISEIAGEKCGIIGRRNTAISIKQAISVEKVIKEKCRKQNAKLYLINSKNYSEVSSYPQETAFDFQFSPVIPREARNPEIYREILRYAQDDKIDYKNINLGLIGKHQAENCSLALSCLTLLSKRDKFSVNEKKLRDALKKINILGRFNILECENKKIIVDGAHNVQKMETFLENLSAIFPQQKFNFLIAFKKGKDYKTMLKRIIPIADKIFLTHFSTKNMDNQWSSIDNQKISSYLKSKKYNNFEIIGNKKSEIQRIIRASKKPVVITGSLYLIGSIYKYLK